jgi:ribosomal protein S18 acetylase RimI-like enzyme
VIREAREVELDDVARMMSAAYREYASGLPDGAWEMYETDITAVRSRLADSTLIVWDDDGEPVGAVTYYPPGAFQTLPPTWAYIRLLAVVPATRGRGIGRALVEEAIDRARADGAEAIGIHTTKWMAAALDLYLSRGFERQPGYDVETGVNDSDGAPIRVEAYRLDLRPGEGGDASSDPG